MAEEKVLEKIRKLLERANDERGSTEGERDTALRMATALMAKHQIEMSQIPKEQQDRNDPRGKFVEQGWSIVWCNMIRGSIARLFDCTYLVGGKINATRGNHIFIGRESNATTAMLMSDWIVRECLREADRVAGHRLKPEGCSFGLGVAARLAARVRQLTAEAAADIQASTGRDLMIIKANEADANEDWIISSGMKVSKSRSVSASNIDSKSYNAGMKHADSINLNKQIKSPAEQSRLK